MQSLFSRKRKYFSTHNKEFYNKEFIQILSDLNSNVSNSHEVLEGNYFYHHHAQNVDLLPDRSRIAKREFLSKNLRFKQNALEIGFNAGHSALLILSSNPKVTYFGVDIGEHSYTQEAGRILQNYFGDRFKLIIGDSQDVLPKLKNERQRYDLIHIDGGHSYQQCFADLRNSTSLLVNPKSTIVLDDIKGEDIMKAFTDYKKEFQINAVRFSKSLENIAFELRAECF
jgi:predicted O-methyltransferase YrrM